MHIITGMLVAALLGKKQKKPLPLIFSAGPVQIVHALPGRIRFRTAPSHLAERDVGRVRDKLPTLDGVQSVEVDPASGSILVQYQEKLLKPELLFAAVVRLLGLETQLEHSPRPLVVKELRSFLDSLNYVVYQKTGGLLDFSSALLILLASVGVKKLVTEGMQAVPQGFTLLWWGFHQLLGQPQE